MRDYAIDNTGLFPAEPISRCSSDAAALEALLKKGRQLFLARCSRIHHNIATLHSFVNDFWNVTRTETVLAQSSWYVDIAREMLHRGDGALGCISRGHLSHRLSESARNRHKALWRGDLVELHDFRQGYGDRNPMRNAYVPASERHRQSVSQSQTSWIHRDSRHRAGEEHSISGLAVCPTQNCISQMFANELNRIPSQRGGDGLAGVVGIALDAMGQCIHTGCGCYERRQLQRELRIAQGDRRKHMDAPHRDL